MSYCPETDAEGVSPRVINRTPRNTKPLELTRAEIRLHQKLSEECIRLLDINGLSTSNQINTMYSGVVGIEAVLAKDWNALIQTAVMGIQAGERVTGVSPFIFSHKDGANRNHASPERTELREMAYRLTHAEAGHTSADVSAALCLRAMVCATLAAERGLIHLSRENFGVVIKTLADEESDLGRSVNWTNELRAYGRRFARAVVKMP